MFPPPVQIKWHAIPGSANRFSLTLIPVTVGFSTLPEVSVYLKTMVPMPMSPGVSSAPAPGSLVAAGSASSDSLTLSPDMIPVFQSSMALSGRRGIFVHPMQQGPDHEGLQAAIPLCSIQGR